MRDPRGRVRDHIARVGENQVGTSIIVAAELRYGAAKKSSSRLSAQLERILDALEVAPFEAPADAFYGGLRARLEGAGRVIGANDLLIAAQALATSRQVTTNRAEGEIHTIMDGGLMTDIFVTSRLDARARMVVPKAVRQALDIRPGEQVGYTIRNGRVVITAARKPLSQDDSFACFEEWASQADTDGYASL